MCNSNSDVAAEIRSCLTGLDQAEAQLRLVRYGSNAVDQKRSRNLLDIFAASCVSRCSSCCWPRQGSTSS